MKSTRIVALLTLFLLGLGKLSFAQLPYTESFESAPFAPFSFAVPPTGYNLSYQFATTVNDHYGRTDQTTLPPGGIDNNSGPYTNVSGSFIIAGEDHDAFGSDGNSIRVMTMQEVNTAGFTNLQFSGDFAAGNANPVCSNGFDEEDTVRVQYSLDGGTTWVDALWFSWVGPCFPGDFFNEPLAVDADLDGIGEGAVLTTTLTTFSFNIPDNPTVVIRVWGNLNSGNEEFAFDNFQITGTPNTTITTGTVPSTPFCKDSSFTLPFTVSGTINPGNDYIAQISDATGSFASPTNIGTLSSTATGSLSMTVTIPGGLPNGTGYRIRVIATNPAVPGTDNGVDLALFDNPNVTINPTDISCNGLTDGQATAVVTGGAGSNNFTWNTGATTPTITGLAAGTYDVVVTDANGCTGVDTTTINEPPALTATATATDESCPGAGDGTITINASGGTGSYEYSGDGITWQVSNTFTGLTPNTYFYFVRDANGCVQLAGATVNSGTGPSLSASVDSVSCNGGSDGLVTLTATGGTTPYDYSDDNITFVGSNVFGGLNAGTYTFYTEDAGGCTAQTTVDVDEPTAITASLSITDETCDGADDGEITVTASGGTAALEYSLDGITYQSSNVFTGLADGPYTVTIRDFNGCTQTVSGSVQPGSVVTLSATADSASCNGGSDGQVTLTAAGGTTPYEYSDDNITFVGSNVFSGLSAGTYTFYTEDVDGCTAQTTIDVDEPTAITASLTIVDETCDGDDDGEITVTASGGTAALEYSLDGITYQSSNVFTGLADGPYTVTVRDFNGCTQTVNGSVQPGSDVTLTASVDSVSCNGGSDGLVTLTATGGTTPYDYSDDNITFVGSNVFGGLSAGTYTFYTEDVEGCAAQTTIDVDEPDAITASLTITDETCNGSDDGEIIVTASGGTAALEYSLDGITYQSSNVFTGLADGPYTVTIRDFNGCTQTVSGSVQPGSVVTLSATADSASCNGGSDGQVTLTAAGGTTPYEYSDDNITFVGSNVFSGLSAGTYTFYTEDVDGCTAQTTIDVDEPTAITASLTIVDETCDGDDDGEITVTASGGTAALEYSLDGITYQSSNVFTGLADGPYTVTVRDFNGCTQTVNGSVQPGSDVTLTASVDSVSCNGGSDGQVTLTASNGTPAYQYSDDNVTFVGSNVFGGLNAGTYTFYTEDVEGCTAQTTIDVDEPDAITASLTITDETCNGSDDGEITVTASGGTAALEYSLDGITYQSSNTFTGLADGPYTVTIRDFNGCTQTVSGSVQPGSDLNLTATVDSVSCNAGSDGQVTLTASGGFTPYEYSDDNITFGGSNVFGGLTAGTYTFYAQDASGCSGQTTVDVEEPDAITASLTIVDESCDGSNDGEITVTASGGTAALEYSLDGITYQSSNIFTGLADGPYTVTIRDFNGCTQTVSGNVQPGAGITLTATADSVNCNGGSDGQVTLTASGGTAPYEYSDDNITFVGSNVFSGLTAGTYTFFVEDVTGCDGQTTIDVDEPTAITASLTIVDETCDGDDDGEITVTASGGTAALEYSLDGITYQSSNVFTGLADGPYTVTIRDFNGCTQTVNGSVQPGSDVTLTASVDSVSCNGGSDGQVTLTASNGTPAYQYSDDNVTFVGSNVFGGLSAGTYTFYTEDADGCAAQTTVDVDEPTAITASLSITDETCDGDNNGQLTVTASGGTAALEYSLDGITYQSSNIFTGLADGPYTVTIRDFNGCTQTVSGSVQPGTLVNLTALVDSVDCNGGNDGQVTLIATNGTAPYQFSDDNITFGGSNVFTGLNAGNYTFYAQDLLGCSAQTTVDVEEPTLLTVSGVVDQDVSCNGLNDGQVTLTGAGGTSPYEYSEDGVTYGASPTFTNQPGGNNQYFIRDVNGCTDNLTLNINEPTPVLADITIDNSISCNGGNDGQITLSASGGTPGYQYSDDGVTFGGTTTFGSLSAGTYTFFVEDANNCQDDTTITLTEPTPVLADITIDNAISCNGGNDGQITLSASGGTPGYQYSDDGVTFGGTTTFGSLSAGTYTFFVEDANNCQDDTTITITEPTPVLADITIDNNVSCNGGNDGQITLSAAGGTAPYQYSDDGVSFGGTATFGSLSAGTYTFFVEDANNCQDDTTITLTEPTPVLADITIDNSVSCNGGSNGQITLSASGGTAPYQYSDDGVTFGGTTTFGGLSAGTYTFFVEDANNCQDDTTITLTEPTPVLADITIDNTINCNGGNNGQITLSASGGTPGYQYSDDGVTFSGTATFGNLSAGTYTFFVEDTNNCQDDTTITITQPTPIGLAIVNTTDISCDGFADGQVELTTTGGTGPFTYATDGVNFTPGAVITGLDSGLVTLYAQDANGCLDSVDATINEPAPLTLGSTIQPVSCNGDADGQVTLAASGGTAPYQYSEDGITYASDSTFTGLTPALYTYFAQDANGCIIDTTVVVTEPAELVINLNATNPACANQATGEVEVLGIGGTLPYQYSSDGTTFGGNPVFSGLNAGNYQFFLEDANGCRDSATVTLTEPDTLELSATTIESFCNGSPNGIIDLTVEGGSPDYSYQWTPGNFTEQDISGLSAGTYDVTVTDLYGCTASLSVTLNEPGPITVTANSVQAACSGEANGSIDISVTGGQAPYFYTWDNGAQVQDLGNVPAGSYTVMVMDSLGCVTDFTVSVGSAPSVNVNLTGTNPTCNNCSDGTATANVTGGQAPFNYVWNIGGTGDTQTGLPQGEYFVTVTDANGCSGSDTLELTFSVGIEEMTASLPGMTLYPNPFRETAFLNVQYPQGTETARVEVVDLTGKTVLEVYNGEVTPGQVQYLLPGQELTAGTYLVRVATNQGEQTMKALRIR